MVCSSEASIASERATRSLCKPALAKRESEQSRKASQANEQANKQTSEVASKQGSKKAAQQGTKQVS